MENISLVLLSLGQIFTARKRLPNQAMGALIQYQALIRNVCCREKATSGFFGGWVVVGWTRAWSISILQLKRCPGRHASYATIKFLASPDSWVLQGSHQPGYIWVWSWVSSRYHIVDVWAFVGAGRTQLAFDSGREWPSPVLYGGR